MTLVTLRQLLGHAAEHGEGVPSPHTGTDATLEEFERCRIG